MKISDPVYIPPPPVPTKRPDNNQLPAQPARPTYTPPPPGSVKGNLINKYA